MSDDGWVKAATANDNLVVDLLLHIKYSSSPSPPPSPPPQSSSKELNWIVRQRRSKTTASNQGAVRVSPTTPLSLTTCATSQSGGTVGLLDGSEESSRQPPGSKVCTYLLCLFSLRCQCFPTYSVAAAGCFFFLSHSAWLPSIQYYSFFRVSRGINSIFHVI